MIKFDLEPQVLKIDEVSSNINVIIDGKKPSENMLEQLCELIVEFHDSILLNTLIENEKIYETDLRYDDIEGSEYVQKVKKNLTPKMDINIPSIRIEMNLPMLTCK